MRVFPCKLMDILNLMQPSDSSRFTVIFIEPCYETSGNPPPANVCGNDCVENKDITHYILCLSQIEVVNCLDLTSKNCKKHF